MRSFPALDIIESFDPAEDYGRAFTACFADDLIITAMAGYHAADHLVAIDGSGNRHDLGEPDGWLVPTADSAWLAITPMTIHHCRAV